MDTSGKLRYLDEPVSTDSTALGLAITGLKGGHSGLDIHLGRGNANILMCRFMFDIADRFDMRLASMEGGSLRNAIPREAFAIVTVPSEKKDDFMAAIKDYEEIYKAEMGTVEPDLSFRASETDRPLTIMDKANQDKLVRLVCGMPNGVIRMDPEMPAVTETSTNLAIVKTGDGEIDVQCLLRSSVDSAKLSLGSSLQSVFELAGAEVTHSGNYPGWKPDVDSPILATMQSVYERDFGKIPDVKVIHAGLECGIIGDVYPGLDMISFGPTIRFPHSPDEKVHIESVQKFWDFLVRTLEEIPVK
jgi:dipeptidase D